jgi:SAM-dependent methyltransferase
MTAAVAGDFDYERRGQGYASRRRTDPRIEAYVHEALGSARTVLNVGAGAGSYEPTDRYVVALEPSAAMRAQRPAHAAPALQGVAAHLPFDDKSFDAAMAMLTVHQWPDLRAGLGEIRRVTRGPVVVLTFDGDALDRFWLADYAPELMEAERRRYPTLDAIGDALGGGATIRVVPVPRDCLDGFTEAYFARPEAFLLEDTRRSQSAWGFVDDAVQARVVERLRTDLDSGAWDERYGSWRRQDSFEGALRLVVQGGQGERS